MAERPLSASGARPAVRNLIPDLELVMIQHFRNTEGRMAVAHELEKASAGFLDLAHFQELLQLAEYKQALDYILPFIKAVDEEFPSLSFRTNTIKTEILKFWVLDLFTTNHRGACLKPLNLFETLIGRTELYVQLDDLVRDRKPLKDIVGLKDTWASLLTRPSNASLAEVVVKEVVLHEGLQRRTRLPDMQITTTRKGEPITRLRQLMLKALQALFPGASPDQLTLFRDPPPGTYPVPSAAPLPPPSSSTSYVPQTSQTDGIAASPANGTSRKRTVDEMTGAPATAASEPKRTKFSDTPPPTWSQPPTQVPQQIVPAAPQVPQHLLANISVPEGQVKSIHFSPKNPNHLLINFATKRFTLLAVVDPRSGAILAEARRPKPVTKALFSPCGTYIGVSEESIFEVLGLDLANKRLTGARFLDPPPQAPITLWDFVSKKHKSYIFVVSAKKACKYYDIDTGKEGRGLDADRALMDGEPVSISSTYQPDVPAAAVTITRKFPAPGIKYFAFPDVDETVPSDSIDLEALAAFDWHESLTISGDAEHIYLLGTNFIQVNGASGIVTLPQGQAPVTGNKRTMSCFNHIVAVPDGTLVHYYRVPCAVHDNPVSVAVTAAPESLEAAAFSPDGSFLALSTSTGSIKVLGLTPSPTANVVISIEKQEPIRIALPSKVPGKLIQLKVLQRIQPPGEGLVVQLRSQKSIKDDRRFIYALQINGKFSRFTWPSDAYPSVQPHTISLEDSRVADENRRPASFFVTSNTAMTCLVSPSGVFVYRMTENGFVHPTSAKPVSFSEQKQTYLPPDGSKLTAFDCHPADNNAYVQGTADGSVIAVKKTEKVFLTGGRSTILGVRYLDLRQYSVQGKTIPGLVGLVAYSADGKVMIWHLKADFDIGESGKPPAMKGIFAIPGNELPTTFNIFPSASQYHSGIDIDNKYRALVWSESTLHVFDVTAKTLVGSWKGDCKITTACFFDSRTILVGMASKELILLNWSPSGSISLIGIIREPGLGGAPASSLCVWYGSNVTIALGTGEVVVCSLDVPKE